jgi:AbiU2
MAKRQPLPFDEALRRTERITSLLAADTWFALRARSALHTANEVIWDHDYDRPSKFADTYNVVQNSMALNVALAVARLFDVSDPGRYPVEQQDKASIPVLATLLTRHDVQDALAEKARGWHPQLIGGRELGEDSCRDALSTALALYDAFTKSNELQDAVSRVRAFRTSRLAHHLFHDEPTDRPLFDDLDLLANFARDCVRATVLGVEGRDHNLGYEEVIKRSIDRPFWEVALSALFAATNQTVR